jgi:hypothetical protein
LALRAHRTFVAAAVVIATVLAPPPGAQARIWLVFPDSTGDAPTIQAAVDSATSGDEVVLGPGTYTWATQGGDMLLGTMVLVGKRITLRSSTGAAQTTLDAQGRGRPLWCYEPTVVSGLTIRGGRSLPGAFGGGVRMNRGQIRHCVITDNECASATNGGGISITNGRVEDCEIVGNRIAPQGRGGGAALFTSHMLRCTVRDNSAGDGGRGGGAAGEESLFQDSRFDNNRIDGLSYGWGGALHSTRDSIVGCVFTRNELRPLDNLGGAIYGTPRLVSGCTFIANEAPGAVSQGAAVYSTTFTTRVEYSTFVGNSSGVFNAVVRNCIITGCTNGPPCAGIIDVACTNAWGNLRGQDSCRGADDGGNMSVDPQFCGVQPEQSGNVDLQSDSPCALAPCGRIGARDVGCNEVGVQPALWSDVKRRYGR